ncbi:hypothetical protein Tco_0135279 [Tanacetum coccineum]
MTNRLRLTMRRHRDTEAESMVSVTIQQDISVFPPMTSPVIGPVPRQDSPNVHGPLPTTTTTTATTTTTLPLPPQPQQGPSDPILIKRIGELEEFIANLVEENQALETRLDKQGSRINKLENMDLTKMIREQTVEFIDSQEIDRKINESVKEVVISSVKHAMRAPLRARFKDLPTSDMKEILLQRSEFFPDVGLEQLVLISSGLKRMQYDHCWYVMVSLTGGSKDKRFYMIDSHLKETAEQWNSYVICTETLGYSGQRVEDSNWELRAIQTQLNLTKPHGVPLDLSLSMIFTSIDSPRAVIFRDRYGVQMIMRFNEIHKFSDGTLQQIDEALDYRVKEFWINRIIQVNAQILEKKDVDRCKNFMFAIRKRTKDKTYLSESRELCWWTDSRRRLPVTAENRMREHLRRHKYRKKDGNPSRANIKQALGSLHLGVCFETFRYREQAKYGDFDGRSSRIRRIKQRWRGGTPRSK